MSKISTLSLLLFACLFAAPLLAQSRQAEYEAAVLRSIQDGTFEGFDCGHSHRDFPQQSHLRACTQLNQGYGTNGWQPASNNGHPSGASFDNNCVVAAQPVPACGFYRVPLAITVFENPAHSGANYLGGTGFAALPDVDINNAITALNNYYANANIVFYEAVPRRRITNVDMYDFYTPFLGSNDPATGGNDGTDDDPQTAAFDRPNIINLYFVGGLNGVYGPSGTTGYAPYPLSRDYSIMAYRALFGTTLPHELGHYLGLKHTHHNVSTNDDNAQFPPEGAMNNGDCLTTGDQICDTWPDPNFTGCRNATCVYQTTPAPPCGVLTINPNSGVNFGGGVSTILQRNIMNYNSFGSCRQDFSPCQYRKANEVLRSCRNNLCDTSVARHFANTTVNDAQSPYKSICTGDAIPTFTALSGCYNWYTVPTGGTPVATATATFTPTPAQLNTSVAGTTFFYIEPVNSFNAACRQTVHVVVSPRPGSGRERSTLANSITLAGGSNDTARVETNGAALSTNQVIGWWLTEGSPISTTATNQATLNAALASATVNGAVVSATPNNIWEATGTATPPSFADIGLSCSTLDPTRNYFLTPFVSSKRAVVPDATCTFTLPTVNTTVGGAAGRRATITAAGITCRPASPPNPPTYTIRVVISGYTGAANNLRLNLRTNSGCALPSAINIFIAGNGTYTYTQADLPGVDLGTTGLCVLAFENGANGMSSATMTATLSITYPGLPAIPFPTVNYTDCVFGTPVAVNCPNNMPVLTAAGCASGTVVGVNGNAWFDVVNAGRIIASINPRGNDLGTVRIDVNDMPAVANNFLGVAYVPRYFNIASSNFAGFATPFPAGAVDVRLYLLQAEIDAYNLANGSSTPVGSLTINHYAADLEDCQHSNNNFGTMLVENIPAALIANSPYSSTSGAGHRLQFSLNHFSELEISGVPVVLSQDMLQSFTGNMTSEGVLLRWWLRPMQLLRSVELQRAGVGGEFFTIASVPYLQGQANYSYLAAQANEGSNYYRLRIEKADGSIVFSQILHFELPSQNKLSLLPNPIQSEGTLVYFSDGEYPQEGLEIIDMAGHRVDYMEWQSQAGMNYKRLVLRHLPAGVYTLRLMQGKNVRTLRFVKTTL